MKLLALALVALFFPVPTSSVVSCGDDPKVGCSGCVKDIPQIKNTGSNRFTVPYEILPQGRWGLDFRSGSCHIEVQPTPTLPGQPGSDAGGDCVQEEPCKVLGTIEIKNTARIGGVPISIQDSRTGRAITVVQPGNRHTLTFGDPATNTPENLICGKEILVEITAVGPGSGGTQVTATREVRWVCGECKKPGRDV